MAYYESTAYWAKRIRERHGREPNIYLPEDQQTIEDMEYIRSYMYEEGEMNCMKTPQRDIDRNKRNARAQQARYFNNHGKSINEKMQTMAVEWEAKRRASNED